MVTWKNRIAELSAQAVATEESASTGPSYISLRSGRMSVRKQPLPGDKIQAVILDAIIERHFYTDKFDAENPVPPACYAFGRDASTMAPHDQAGSKQSDRCAKCPNNAWGTGTDGKGKACKEVRRMSLLPEPALEGDVASEEVLMLKLPVTSVKNYSSLVTRCNAMGKATFQGVTEIASVPDNKTQFQVTFKWLSSIDDDATLEALVNKVDAIQEDLWKPYPAAPETTAPKKAAKY